MDATNKPFIVAELSKSWQGGRAVSGDPRPIAELFELLIDVNLERGYRLDQFQLYRAFGPAGELVETIVAVFERGYLAVESLAALRGSVQAGAGHESRNGSPATTVGVCSAEGR